ALLVGLLGAASYFEVLVGLAESRKPPSMELILYSLFGVPSQYFVLAATVAGFSQARIRWRSWRQTASETLPLIQPLKLVATTCFIAIAIVAAGPIFGALGLAFWFLPLRHLF